MVAHGDVEFEWVGNILIYKLSGNFNEEGLMLLVKKRKLFFEKLPKTQWFRIIYLADNVFSSENVLLVGEGMQQQSINDGCIDSITVAANEYLKRIRIHHESSNDIKSTYADTLDGALSIFKQHPDFVED